MTRIRSSRSFYWVFVLGILSGLGIICWRAIVFQTQNASFHWPTVTGTILQSVRTYVQESRHSHYRVDIVYRYEVNGAHYISRQISLWSPDLSASDNRGFVPTHPAGSEVTVYYDPKQFGNAVLIPGADEKVNELLMAMGGLSVVASLLGIIQALRRQPALTALLNAPDAQTRAVEMRKGDVEKGINAFLANFLIAGGFLILALLFLMPPFLKGPAIVLEARPPTPQWEYVAGIISVSGCLFFFARAARRSRSAQCPVCGNFLNKGVYESRRCGRCRTRIVFEDQVGQLQAAGQQDATEESNNQRAHKIESHPHTRVISEFQVSRVVDVAGFMAGPILFVWLLAAVARQFDYGIAMLFTIIFCAIGGCYYVWPDAPARKRKHSRVARSVKDVPQAVETEEKPGPYLYDFSIILSAPVALVGYLLWLTWQHRVLDMKSLTVVTLGFPAAIGITTYMCKFRFTRATKLQIPNPPIFVPMTLLALWLVGTFISVVFLVCLVLKWMG